MLLSTKGFCEAVDTSAHRPLPFPYPFRPFPLLFRRLSTTLLAGLKLLLFA